MIEKKRIERPSALSVLCVCPCVCVLSEDSYFAPHTLGLLQTMRKVFALMS